jgi:CheY-like chemotaxis protein
MPSGGTLTIETENTVLDETYLKKHPQCKPGFYVVLVVSDTGVGMDEETQKHVFEPFFTTKEEGRGTGLGLATVYGIVKQSGGWIWLYSEPGKGSVFRIYLPRTDEVVHVDPESEAVGARLRGSETILVVEDQAQVREFACSVLEMHGYRVLQAGSADEALRIANLSNARIDLLLTDLVMSGLNGWELSEQMRRTRPEILTLFMSGYTKQVIARNGILEAGIEYMQKPFDADGLLTKVRSLFDSRV